MGMSRSENMRRIRSKNTAPELLVRRLLRSLGLAAYRIHRKDIPGKPDIAFIGRKKAIFVQGCFWHGHDCKEGVRRPKTNQDYWLPKIERTVARDLEHKVALEAEGWSVLVIWDCELCDIQAIASRLTSFLEVDKNEYQGMAPSANGHST